MTRAEDLLQALNGLRKAAIKELSGEAREEAFLYIEELFRLAGFDGEDAGEVGSEPAPPFAVALAQVRTQAEGELAGNTFDLVSKMLDDLAALPSAPAASHAAAQAAEAGLSFEELAASAKTRVEQMAASLGVEAVQHYAPPAYEQQEIQAQQDEMLADLEFEKRSSEPCSMPDIVTLPEQIAPPAPASADAPLAAASAREVAEATHDFGTPAAEAGPVPEYAASREHRSAELKPAAPAPAPAPEPAPVIITKAEPRRASPAPGSAAATKIEAAPKREKEPEKTFFGLWLDMVFGRRK